MKHIAKALIAMLICMAALIGPSMAASYTLVGCDERDVDLTDGDETFIDLDYRTTVIEDEDGVFAYHPYAKVKIAELIDEGDGDFTIVPMAAGKVSVYYTLEQNGRTYNPYFGLTVLSTCVEPEPEPEPVVDCQCVIFGLASPLDGAVYQAGDTVQIRTHFDACDGNCFQKSQLYLDGVPTNCDFVATEGEHLIEARSFRCEGEIPNIIVTGEEIGYDSAMITVEAEA